MVFGVYACFYCDAMALIVHCMLYFSFCVCGLPFTIHALYFVFSIHLECHVN